MPFSQLLAKHSNTALPSHAGSNEPFANVLLPGEVAAEPLGEAVEMYYCSPSIRAKDSVPI